MRNETSRVRELERVMGKRIEGEEEDEREKSGNEIWEGELEICREMRDGMRD